MIVILKPDADLQTQNRLIDWIRSQNVEVQIAQGQRQTTLCLLGDTAQIDAEQISAWRIVICSLSSCPASAARFSVARRTEAISRRLSAGGSGRRDLTATSPS